MSHEKINIQSYPQPPAIEDGVPAVSMDIDLGSYVHKGQVIDFDYDAYRTIAHDMGLSDEAIDRLEVRLEKRSVGSRAGSMSTDKHAPQMSVGFNRGKFRARKRSLNNTVGHETRHYADMHAGELAETSPAYRRAQLLNPINTKLVWLGGLVDGLAAVTDKPSLLIPSAGLQAAGALGMAYVFKNYVRDPAEVRARKSGRKYKNSGVISVNKRIDTAREAQAD